VIALCSPSPHRLFRILSACLVLAMIQPARAQQDQPAEDPPAAASSGKPLTPAEYASRIQTFEQLVASCRAAMTAEHCSGSQVQSALEVQLAGATRSIRYDWLRALLDEAAHPPKERAKPASKPANPTLGLRDEDQPLDQLPTIQSRLEAAQKRLAEERAHVLALAGQPSAASPGSSADRQRAILATILAGKDYRLIQPQRTLLQRVLEKIQQWIIRFFSAISEAGRGKPWIGTTVEVFVVSILCLGLVWFLIRVERQSRLVNASLMPGLGAASARDWQLWLEDARQAASRGAWRDAVHFLYWSSISRLESSGLWPADRARTPREYLALLAPENAQRPALLALTRTFERTWYAGRAATESDFLQAEQQASQLGARRVDRRSGKAGSV